MIKYLQIMSGYRIDGLFEMALCFALREVKREERG